MAENKPERHHILGASQAERWMNCPGSVRATADMPDSTSIYAEEGRLAHEIAAICLKNPELTPADILKGWMRDDTTMADNVQYYLDYVRSVLAEHPDAVMFVEEEVSFDEWVPGGFGTADVILIYGDTIHIIDLKYGQGVKVHAEYGGLPNPQMGIYSLGAYQRFELAYDFKTVVMTIVQPRLDHISTHAMTVEELLSFGRNVKQAAEEAMLEDAKFVPGEAQCRWCKIKATCRARAEWIKATAWDDFADEVKAEPALLSLDEIAEIYPKLDAIESWCKDMRRHTLELALRGEVIPGHKIVEGRSMRRWTDAAPELLMMRAPDKADELFVKSLIPIGKAEKLLGKKDPIFAQVTYKPQGKPVLVPESDKRQPFKPSVDVDFADDFTETEE